MGIDSRNKSYTTTDVPSCVRCGYCCNKAICSYGEDDGHGRCWFLAKDDIKIGTFTCAIRSKIVEREAGSSIPMFDHYCSSSVFNDVRDDVIRKKKNVGR